VEYTRIGTWTYIHRRPELRYTAWGAPLGHPAGPDSETASATFFAEGRGRLRSALIWGRWHRRGRIHLNTAESPVGQTDLSFPAPPVARWIQLGMGLRVVGPARSELDLRTGWTERHGQSRGLEEGGDPWAPPHEAAGGFWASFALSLSLGPWTADF
jgi:hypothetical protein